LAAKKKFVPSFDKYSGVITDVLFDHLLAKHFSEFHAVSLNDFSKNAYEELKLYYADFPLGARRFYDYMVHHNILLRYAEEEGINQVLTGISNRIGHKIQLQDALEIFRNSEAEMYDYFSLFFPELVIFSESIQRNFPKQSTVK
jgi:acyl carrier protein phosphodiesterase